MDGLTGRILVVNFLEHRAEKWNQRDALGFCFASDFSEYRHPLLRPML